MTRGLFLISPISNSLIHNSSCNPCRGSLAWQRGVVLCWPAWPGSVQAWFSGPTGPASSCLWRPLLALGMPSTSKRSYRPQHLPTYLPTTGHTRCAKTPPPLYYSGRAVIHLVGWRWLSRRRFYLLSLPGFILSATTHTHVLSTHSHKHTTVSLPPRITITRRLVYRTPFAHRTQSGPSLVHCLLLNNIH